MTTPLRGPRTYQFLRNNSVLAGDSSSGFRRCISHFFMAARNTTEGVREKEQRTNMGLVNSKSKKGSSVKLHFLCISRLSLTCIFLAKLLQATRKADSSLIVFLTADRCRLRTANSSCLSSSLLLVSISPDWSLLLSVVDCPSAWLFAHWLLWVPFPNSSDWRSLAHFRSLRRSRAQAFV